MTQAVLNSGINWFLSYKAINYNEETSLRWNSIYANSALANDSMLARISSYSLLDKEN